MRRAVAVGTSITGLVLVLGAAPAHAASSPKASCVGIIVSTLAPAGQFDVHQFKAMARADGAPTFGAFVSFGARQPDANDTFAECFPAP